MREWSSADYQGKSIEKDALMERDSLVDDHDYEYEQE